LALHAAHMTASLLAESVVSILYWCFSENNGRSGDAVVDVRGSHWRCCCLSYSILGLGLGLLVKTLYSRPCLVMDIRSPGMINSVDVHQCMQFKAARKRTSGDAAMDHACTVTCSPMRAQMYLIYTSCSILHSALHSHAKQCLTLSQRMLSLHRT
jgi:hypothetical protein